MSLDDTLLHIWCLMSVETCFLTICNDLKWRFWPKNLHFGVFGGGEFVPKQYKPAAWVKSCWVYNLRELAHAMWLNSRWKYRAWFNSRKGTFIHSVGSECYLMGEEQFSRNNNLILQSIVTFWETIEQQPSYTNEDFPEEHNFANFFFWVFCQISLWQARRT